MPLFVGRGVGVPAREPSPRNSGPSGTCVNCAASRTCCKHVSQLPSRCLRDVHTVNGRTLIATLIEDAPSEVAMVRCNRHQRDLTTSSKPGCILDFSVSYKQQTQPAIRSHVALRVSYTAINYEKPLASGRYTLSRCFFTMSGQSSRVGLVSSSRQQLSPQLFPIISLLHFANEKVASVYFTNYY